jgi:hypothetical protein
MKEEEKDDDDDDEEEEEEEQERLQERAFAEIFDLVSAYSRERCEYEEKTREAMMSIASARYSMGHLGWEAVANEVVAAAAAAAVGVGDDDDNDDESAEKRKRKPPKMIPVHARRVTETFRELTKASAEVLSLKNNLERKVERYERRYLRDRAATTTLQTGNA